MARFAFVNGKLVEVQGQPILPVPPTPTPGGLTLSSNAPIIPEPAPLPRALPTQTFINQRQGSPNLTNIYTPGAPRVGTNIYTPSPAPAPNIYTAPRRGPIVDASTSAEDRRLARIGLDQRGRIEASTSGTSEPDFYVQWTMEPVRVTSKDTNKYGPNAAGVLGVVSSVGSLSEEAVKVAVAARAAERGAAWGVARDAAYDYAWNAARDAAYNDAWNAAYNAAWGVARDAAYDDAVFAARDAAVGEAARGELTPEQYKLLTGPLAVGVMYDRIMASLPKNDRGSFRSAVAAAKPTSPEQVQQIANLPRRAMDNLGSLKGDLSFDKKIAAVSRVNRATTADRAERESNRSKAVGGMQ